MKKLFFILLTAHSFWLTAFSQQGAKIITTDVLVIGGGVGGTAAAIQCARMGAKTVLVEETTMLGGMLTAAGVSCTDGNDQLPSGMWEEFRQALYKHYGRKKLNTGWVSNTNFEPHVGDSIFKAWAAAEKSLTVYFGYGFEKVKKVSEVNKVSKVTGANFKSNDGTSALWIYAKVIIDGTELGDVLANAGAAYDLGMDDPELSAEKEAREKNNIIQDLTWAAVLKNYGEGADKTIARPADYDSTLYFCSTADAPCDGKPYAFDTKKVLDYGKLPLSPGKKGEKYMLNWPPHGNDYYLNIVESSNALRVKGYELAKQQTLGFIYFLQTTLGMPHIGLADDELNGGMALIPYHREGRRMKGVVRLNINHLKNPYNYNLYRTGISVGDYPVDHHHGRYPGKVPELEFPEIPAFNIPLGCLIPEKTEGLIVCEKGISVSNIVNGSTRLQPVVLLTGQAAGMLAAVSIKEKIRVRNVNVRTVQEELLKRKCYLMPFTDVKPDDPHWEAIQRVGVTGILKGTGKPEGWANKMMFYPDSNLTVADLYKGFENYFPKKSLYTHDSINRVVNFSILIEMLTGFFNANPQNGMTKFIPPLVKEDQVNVADKNIEPAWKTIRKKMYNDQALTKKEIAVLISKYLDPFFRDISVNGNFSDKLYNWGK